MPYIEKRIRAGAVTEVYNYFSARYGKKAYRGTKQGITTEKQKTINERFAEMKLRGLINANFVPGDLHLVLTYRDSVKSEDTRVFLGKFMRRLRSLYSKNKKTLRYICVTEYERKRPHHHIIVNFHELREIQKLWEHGMVRATPLQEDRNYGRLASYLIKETSKTFRSDEAVFEKRWNASKNLIKPTVETEIVNADTWEEFPCVPKDYILDEDSFETGVDEFGRWYRRYTLVRVNFNKGKERVYCVDCIFCVKGACSKGKRKICRPLDSCKEGEEE